MTLRRPSGFIAPCLPSKVARPPTGPLWVHEIKHDDYRPMVCRDGQRVRCFTRNGHDWADRFTGIIETFRQDRSKSFHLLPHNHEQAMAQLPANIFCICRLALLRCS